MDARYGPEAALENTLKYVAAYGALSTFGHRFEEVEFRILRAFQSHPGASFDFGSVHKILGLDSESSLRELAMSKVAWTLQHHFSARAWCVGYKLVQAANGQFYSRVVDQIRELGLPTRTQVDLSTFYKHVGRDETYSRIDAVFIDSVEGVIRPVKGCTFSSLKKVNKRLRDGRMAEPTLFGAFDRVVDGVCIPRKQIATLELASQLLAKAFPACTIEPVLCIVDDVDAGWHYQVHGIDRKRLAEVFHNPLLPLDVFPLQGSSVGLRSNDAALAKLSTIPSFAVTSPLSALPVNRAARCHMMLDAIWRAQSSEHGLRRLTYKELTRDLRDRFLIVYPADLQRHDMQDCLTCGPTSFVRKAHRDSGRQFALTDVGVFEVLFNRRLMSMAGLHTADDLDLDASVLAPIRKQAKLWSSYDDGTVV